MTVLRGDCVEVMAGMDADSIDAIVCDPPYGLEFMGKEWDRLEGDAWRTGGGFSKPGIGERHTAWVSYGQGDSANATCESCGGRMRGARKCSCADPVWRVKGKPLESAGVDSRQAQGRKMEHWHHAWATAALRVAKPGAYLLAFGGTRTVHRMTCALEDAGWVIRDMLIWGYASGFPKSRASLKPAYEPIVLARKPGVSRDLRIDAARIPSAEDNARKPAVVADTAAPFGKGYAMGGNGHEAGRWPANLVLTDPILDGGWEGVVGGGETGPGAWTQASSIYGTPMERESGTTRTEPKGTASRYFYIPKAPRKERILSDGRRSPHPTQKPEALIRHLVNLVTPTGGTVLDPFLGSGTLGVVCEGLGVQWVGIEREPEYADWAEARIADKTPEWAA